MTEMEKESFEKAGLSTPEIVEIQKGMEDIELGNYRDSNEVFQRLQDKILLDNLANQPDV